MPRSNRKRALAALAGVVTLAVAGGLLVPLWKGAATSSRGMPGASAPPVRYDGQTVEILDHWTNTDRAAFEAVLRAFTARTGAEVKPFRDGAPVLSRLATDRGPDLALLSSWKQVEDLAAEGSVTPLTGEVEAAVRTHFSDAWRQLGTVDGKLYGFPFVVANQSVVWYRADVFATAGVAPPSTWGDMVEMTRTLSGKSTSPMAACGGSGWVLTDWFENIYLRVAGAEKYDQLGKHQIAWTDPTVIETLRLLGDYWKMPGALQGGHGGAVRQDFDQCVRDVFGTPPRSAMLAAGSFVAPEVARLGQARLGVEGRYFDWPSINGSRPAVIAGGDLVVAFRDTPAVMALAAFLASPEAAKIMAGSAGHLSANINLDPAAYPDDTTRSLARGLNQAEVVRPDLSDAMPLSFAGNDLSPLWWLLQEYLEDPTDPEALAQRLEAAARKAYAPDR